MARARTKIIETGEFVIVTSGESWSHRVVMVGIARERFDIGALAVEIRTMHRDGGLLDGAFMDDIGTFCRELVRRGLVERFDAWKDVWCDEYGDFDPEVHDERATKLDQDDED